MTSLYEKYPHFIDSDPRRFRSVPYTVSSEFMQARHDVFFQNITLENKTVLDLGCCVGYTGAYVLDNGSKLYHGVEFSRDLHSLAFDNLSKSFEKNKFVTSNLSAEKFLETNTASFDITLASGVIYAIKDPVSFIEKILSISDIVIIESVIPHRPESLTNTDIFKILLDEPFISYGQQHINYNNTEQNANFIGSRPSPGLVKLLLNLNGFEVSVVEHQKMESLFPKIFHTTGRFLIVGKKTQNKTYPVGYADNVSSGNVKLTKFPNLT